jgi:membrane fusion protein (multidrug efflux system)
MEGTRQGPAPAAAGARGGSESEAKAKSGPSPAVRLLLIALGIVALLGVVVFAVSYFAYATTHETTDDATIDADQVQVTSKIAERVERVLVDTNQQVRRGQLLIELEDTDESNRYAQALASVAAQRASTQAALANVALTRATQNAQNLQNTGEIDQARAGITSASQQARSSDQQIAVASAAVDTAAAQLKAAQDALPGALQQLRRAQADLQRTTSLVSTGDVAVTQLDADRATYEQARSSYAQARANVGAAQATLAQAQQKLTSQRFATSSQQAQIGVSQAELTTAQGKLAESSAPSRISAQQATAQAQDAQTPSLLAQLKTAKDNLGYTRITAPISGYVGQKNVEIGAVVAPGVSLLTLVPRSIYITANFKETQIGHMHTGDEVDINVDAYKGVKFTGHVEDLSPASENTFSLVPAQNATGNFVKVTQRLPVRILFDHPDPKYPLRPGLSVETSVKVK